jgi:hypothetical protein
MAASMCGVGVSSAYPPVLERKLFGLKKNYVVITTPYNYP